MKDRDWRVRTRGERAEGGTYSYLACRSYQIDHLIAAAPQPAGAFFVIAPGRFKKAFHMTGIIRVIFPDIRRFAVGHVRCRSSIIQTNQRSCEYLRTETFVMWICLPVGHTEVGYWRNT